VTRPAVLVGALPFLTTLAATAAAAAVQAPGPPVFGVQVESVHVDAFVTRAGRTLRGLSASDFELKDNGVRQRLDLVAAESRPLMAMLAFDTSLSVAGEKLAALRTAGEAFLDSMRPEDEIALLSFSEKITWRARPTRDRALLRGALGQLRPSGSTAALDALYAGLLLPAAQGRTLVVLFSDGEDNQSWLDHRQLRAAAERSSALIHVVGLRPADPPVGGQGLRGLPPEPEHIAALREIAEVTGGHYWEAETPERLKHAFAAIANAMGQRYVLRYEPQGARQPGWHRIELRLRGHKGDVHARRGYWVAMR